MLVFFCVVSSVITSLFWFIDFTNKRVWSSLEGKNPYALSAAHSEG